MSACADDECIRIFHQRGGEVFSRRIDHFIGYFFDGFLYKRYFIIDNYFHNAFVYCRQS